MFQVNLQTYKILLWNLLYNEDPPPPSRMKNINLGKLRGRYLGKRRLTPQQLWMSEKRLEPSSSEEKWKSEFVFEKNCNASTLKLMLSWVYLGMTGCWMLVSDKNQMRINSPETKSPVTADSNFANDVFFVILNSATLLEQKTLNVTKIENNF